MNSEEVKARIAAGLDTEVLDVNGGAGKFEVLVVSAAFEGALPVKRQQMVYACLRDVIGDGSVHAVTMQTFTPTQWAERG